MEHGIARYYLRLISHGLGGGNPLGDMAMMNIEQRVRKKDYYGTYLYPISEMLKDEEIPKIQEEIRQDWKRHIPPDDLEKAVNIVPDIIKVAKILGDVIDKHHKVNKKGLTAYHAFIDFINHPTPARLVKTLADNPQEALEAIYKLHVKLYHLLPEFFEKESGIEHMIPASRREQIRQEALRELEGIIEEEKKMEEQITGKLVATFEDRALAEEYASLKGGRVIQTSEGKYAVVIEEVDKAKPVATFEDEALAREFASLKGWRVIKTPEGRYAVVIEGKVKHPSPQEKSVDRAFNRPSRPETRAESHKRPAHDEHEAQIPVRENNLEGDEKEAKKTKKREPHVEEVFNPRDEQITKHPETRDKQVRKEKEKKSTALPHNGSRGLKLKRSYALQDKLEGTFIPYTIMYSKDPVGEITALAQAYKEVVDGVINGRIKSIVDMTGYGKMKRREFQDKGYKRAKEFAKSIGKPEVPWQKEVRLEYLVETYRYAAIMLHDAAELAREILQHPENYGIDPKLPESEKKSKIAEIVLDKLREERTSLSRD